MKQSLLLSKPLAVAVLTSIVVAMGLTSALAVVNFRRGNIAMLVINVASIVVQLAVAIVEIAVLSR